METIQKRWLTVLLTTALAATVTTPVGAQAQADNRFEVTDGQFVMIVAGDSTGMDVVWVSDPEVEVVTASGDPVTARWAGHLTPTQVRAADDWLATHETDCRVSVSRPWKERGTYHVFVKNKSSQHCHGPGVDRHRSTLNLQARPNSDEFFYTQETDTWSTLAGNSIRLQLAHQCVRARTYQWRSERYGTVYFGNGDRVYLPVIRTSPPRNYCF
ncbi:MAG: hypothetical protein OXS29_06360 [bacterium]|nr:hypothetical protein [bacterium]MDE0440020.1 hypothetical protein [bacterium]